MQEILLPPAIAEIVETAPLPAAYEKAKDALAVCEQLDELVEWIDKAEAIASYARQVQGPNA